MRWSGSGEGEGDGEALGDATARLGVGVSCAAPELHPAASARAASAAPAADLLTQRTISDGRGLPSIRPFGPNEPCRGRGYTRWAPKVPVRARTRAGKSTGGLGRARPSPR